MKRMIIFITVFTTVFCACSGGDNNTVSDNVTGAAVSGTAIGHAVSEDDLPEYDVSGDAAEEADEEEKVNEADKWNSDLDITVIMAKKDGPMLSERVDSTQKGIELPYYPTFATNPIKGDDGNCYYFRYQEKKKEGKLTFYMNNAVKICETVLPEKYHKRNYFITSFFKLGEQFWVKFETDDYDDGVLVPVRIKDGRWGDDIKVDRMRHVIFYKDSFYFFRTDSGELDITDMDGNRRSLEFESDEKQPTLQTIIDDKLYYIVTEKTERYESIVMRCNMDGSQKEDLFRYYGELHEAATDRDYSYLTIDGEYLYLFKPWSDFMLTRIPLYGGEVEKIAVTDWYQLTEDSIYYLDETGRICRADKDLKGRREVVTLRDEYPTEAPLFFCVDGHLLMERYNQDSKDIFRRMCNWEVWELISDYSMNYSDEYYWVAENGEVEDIIPGVGIKKRYYEWYEFALEYDEKYDDDDY